MMLRYFPVLDWKHGNELSPQFAVNESLNELVSAMN